MDRKNELLTKYNNMSWILLEYEVIHFLSNSYFIDESWLKLRKISDETYDRKLEAWKKIARECNLQDERPVGCGTEQGSVKIVLDKFLAPPFEFNRIPHIWPDEETETDEELSVRMYIETEDLFQLQLLIIS